jgi:photosystem II stability/assembly factor-like uncharacterized protein
MAIPVKSRAHGNEIHQSSKQGSPHLASHAPTERNISFLQPMTLGRRKGELLTNASSDSFTIYSVYINDFNDANGDGYFESVDFVIDIDALNPNDTVKTSIVVTTEFGDSLGTFGPYVFVGTKADFTILGPFERSEISTRISQDVSFYFDAGPGGNPGTCSAPIEGPSNQPVIFSVEPIRVVDADLNGFAESWWFEIDINAANGRDTVVTGVSISSGFGDTLLTTGSHTFVGNSVSDNLVLGPMISEDLQLSEDSFVGFVVQALIGGGKYELSVPVQQVSNRAVIFWGWVTSEVDADWNHYVEELWLDVDLDASDGVSQMNAEVEVTTEVGYTVGTFGPFSFEGWDYSSALIGSITGSKVGIESPSLVGLRLRVKPGTAVFELDAKMQPPGDWSGDPNWTGGIWYAGRAQSVKVVSDRFVWFAGEQGFVGTAFSPSSMYRDVSLPGVEDIVVAIEALGMDTAFVSTSRSGGASIFRTIDGGKLWSEVCVLDGGFINGICMYSSQNGFALGDPINGRWVLLQTSDGGASWQEKPTAPPQQDQENGWNNAVCAVDSKHWWYGTNNGRVYYSTDAGSTWSYGRTTGRNSYGVWFNNSNEGIAVFDDGTAERSTDGGKTWGGVPISGGRLVGTAISGCGTSDLWITKEDQLLRSNDNGQSWRLSSFAEHGNLTHISARKIGSRMICVAVSDAGSVMWFDDAQTSAGNNEASKEMPRAFILDQNYPNPFNPSTNIHYGLPNRSHVTLTVFNNLGQQVAILQNGEQEAGYHDVKFDASGLSSGVYFYRMQAGSYVESKKVLLVR